MLDDLKKFSQQQAAKDQEKLDILRKGHQQDLDRAQKIQQILKDHQVK